MKYGPDIAIVANLIGDPARANMVMALMSGQALSAADLAREAGVTPSTATGHLNKLVSAGLLCVRKQGRNRYFDLAESDVVQAVEALIAVAARAGHLRARPGPKDEAMRHARSCYDHLGGRLAVDLFGRWLACGVLCWRNGEVHLTRKGRSFLAERGIEGCHFGRRQASTVPLLHGLERAAASLGRYLGRGSSRAGRGAGLGGPRAAPAPGFLQQAGRREFRALVFIAVAGRFLIGNNSIDQPRSVRPRPMAMRIRSAVWLTPSFSLMRLSVLATVL